MSPSSRPPVAAPDRGTHRVRAVDDSRGHRRRAGLRLDDDVAPAEEVAVTSTDARSASARRLGVAALAVLALIWGYSWVVTKAGLQYVQPFTFAAMHTSLGALSLLALMAALRRPLRPRAVRLTLVVGLLQTTGFQGLTLWALADAGAGRVAVLAYSMPFWLLLMAWAVFGERLHGLEWLAVGTALAGMVLVLAPWDLRGTWSSVLAVSAGVVWAASSMVVKVLHRRHHVDVLSLAAWQMLVGSVPLMIIAAATWEQAPAWSTTLVLSLAYNVLLANAVGLCLWMYTLRALPVGDAGFGTLAIPIVGVVCAWIQLGERPTMVESVGMTLVIAALAVAAARGATAKRSRLP